MADVAQVEVVVAHSERATLRVGDTFLKVDADDTRIDTEVAALSIVPIPTPHVLWRKPNVLALAAVPGTALGRLGQPSQASSTAWIRAGAAIRTLHDSPPPAWSSRNLAALIEGFDAECDWLVTNGVLAAELVAHNRGLARAALQPRTPSFIHGDLQVEHVFIDGDDVAGVIDWSEAGRGDAHYDLATLTLGHPGHLDDVLAGYGGDADRNVIRGWWSVRSLGVIRWLIQHGFDPSAPGCEIDVLKAQ